LTTASETRRWAAQWAEGLIAGDVVILQGPLGAGKTTIAQGIAIGLGVTETVTSPTFALVHEYGGRLPLFHMDLYRLSGEDEFEQMGGWEYFHRHGVCLIEWAERLGAALTGPRWNLFIEWRTRGRMVTITKEGT